MQHVVVWVDLPVKKLERAMKFYSKVLGVELQEAKGTPKRYSFFPFAPGVVSGGLVEDPDHTPSLGGALIYLAAGDDLSGSLGRVEAAGGKVLMPKTSMGKHGFTAQFQDTEGNRVALHSMN